MRYAQASQRGRPACPVCKRANCLVLEQPLGQFWRCPSCAYMWPRFPADFRRRLREAVATKKKFDAAVAKQLRQIQGRDAAEPAFDDYRSFVFGGCSWALTHNQATIVRLLDEGRRKGRPDVPGEQLLDSIETRRGPGVGLVRDYWRGRNHALWGTLICPSHRGFYRLALGVLPKMTSPRFDDVNPALRHLVDPQAKPPAAWPPRPKRQKVSKRKGRKRA